MVFSIKQTKIVVLISCLIFIGLVVAFPYMKKPKEGLERASYCNGFAIQTKEMKPSSDQKEVYNECIKNYVKS